MSLFDPAEMDRFEVAERLEEEAALEDDLLDDESRSEGEFFPLAVDRVEADGWEAWL